MPAAFTHTYIAHLILERLAAGTDEGNGSIRVALPPTLAGTASVRIPSSSVDLLLENPGSFCLGSASPDFFADVITGITTSHQPELQTKTLSHFLTTFSASVRWNDSHQISWLLGWFCHLCADVFGHHWVGNEAKGPFESWIDTPPEVVRKHLGIEMVWADQARAGVGRDFLPIYIQKEFGKTISLSPDSQEKERAFLFQRNLVLDAMLTDGAPLCEAYYDKGNATPQIIQPLIKIRGWRGWHTQQIESIQKIKDWNNSLVGRLADFDLPRLSDQQLAAMRLDCPLCKAHGLATTTVEAACPTCAGTGIVERVALKACPICDNEHQARVACSTCEGLPDALRDACPDCHGERERDLPCPICGITRAAAQYVRGECPHCKGAKVIHRNLDEACPFCKGQKALEKVLGDPEFSSRDLVNLICDRLRIYHEARRQRIDRLVDTYQEAHERLTLLMVKANAPGAMAVKDCFASFISQAKDFAISQLTFSDLVPELAMYQDTVSKSIKDIFDLFLDLVPDGWIETIEKLKQEVLDTAVTTVANYLGSPLLKDAEEQAVKRVLAQQSLASLVWRRRAPMIVRPPARRQGPPLLFAPVADAVTLFLLAIQGCEPTRNGLASAFEKLGTANNIDTMEQPKKLTFFDDPGFAWDARFRLVGKNRPGEEGRLSINI